MSYIGNQPTTVAFPYDTFSGTGSQTAYTMQLAPANTASVMVYVSGVKQDPSTYSVSGTTLTFSAAPPSGTNNISAIYLGIPASGVVNTAYRNVSEATATAGQTSFTVPSYTVGYIDVFRNGVRLNSADYTATTGTTVVLTAGATAGDTLAFESFYVSSILGAIPQTAGAVTTPYILDGAVTQAKLAAGVAGNGPVFSVTNSTTQFYSVSTFTKVAFQTKTFDSASCFDNTTNYRYTPNVAGYYMFFAEASHDWGGAAGTAINTMIYKNGSNYQSASNRGNTGAGPYGGLQVSSLIYMNGSTDYVEVYVWSNNGSPQLNTNNTGGATIFSGYLARTA